LFKAQITVPCIGSVVDIEESGLPVADPAVGLEAIDIDLLLIKHGGAGPAFRRRNVSYDVRNATVLVEIECEDQAWLTNAINAVNALSDLPEAVALAHEEMIDADTELSLGDRATRKAQIRSKQTGGLAVNQTVQDKTR